MSEEKKKLLSDSKKVFLLRMVLFLIFSVGIPFTYLTIKYDLFKPTTSIQVGFWGVFAFALLCVVVFVMIRSYIIAMKTKYSYLKQILEGFIKVVLPIIFVIVACKYLENNMKMVVEAMYIILPCEIVAILINPLPKWCYDNNVEGIMEISEKVFRRKKEIDNEGE